MIGELAVLLLSLVVLAKASDLIVENSLVLAHYFKMGEFAVGFLLVSLATSLPELSIAVTSVLEKASSVSVGNVLGANISDITLVLGLALATSAFAVSKSDGWKSLNLLALAALAPFLIIFFPGVLSSLLLIAAFIFYAFISTRQRLEKQRESPSKQRALFAALFFSFGIILLLVSADFTVKSAVFFASLLNVSQVSLGATVVALGTTLPELSVSLQSVRRRNYSLALGNSIGSTVVNSTLVLGIGSLYSFGNGVFTFLSLFFLASTLIVSSILRSGKATKNHGLFLILVYALFLVSALALETAF